VTPAGGRPILVLLLSLVGATAAPAQDLPASAPASQAEPKQPPPPLFPRHRRGLYRNAVGTEVIDATPQSPPLDSDDPGVPEKGAYEINFTTHVDDTRARQQIDLLRVDANYGVLPTIAGYKLPSQIKVECPVAAAHEPGGPVNVGIGTAAIGLKVNFYRDPHRGIAVSIYPQLEFTPAGAGAVRKGLAEPGQAVILPLLVSREFHEFSFVFNSGVEVPFHGEDRHARSTVGAGLGRALTRKVAGMFELRTDSTLAFKEDRLVYVNGGVIYGVRNAVVYASVGHSLFADDGPHRYAGIGLKLLVDPPKKNSAAAPFGKN
jgi:hypothetical protein